MVLICVPLDDQVPDGIRSRSVHRMPPSKWEVPTGFMMPLIKGSGLRPFTSSRSVRTPRRLAKETHRRSMDSQNFLRQGTRTPSFSPPKETVCQQRNRMSVHFEPAGRICGWASAEPSADGDTTSTSNSAQFLFMFRYDKLKLDYSSMEYYCSLLQLLIDLEACLKRCCSSHIDKTLTHCCKNSKETFGTTSASRCFLLQGSGNYCFHLSDRFLSKWSDFVLQGRLFHMQSFSARLHGDFSPRGWTLNPLLVVPEHKLSSQLQLQF